MIKSFKKNLIIGSTLFISAVACAQDAAPAASAASSGLTPNSTLLYLLIAACAVMLFAVFMLGNVLVSLTKIAINKGTFKAVSVLLLMLVSGFAFSQAGAAAPAVDAGTKPGLGLDIIIGAFVLLVELLVVIWMLMRISSLIAAIADDKNIAAGFNLPSFFDNLNASVAVEKEHDILLDHDYDGIKELDNSLPPWWKYSFYISIVWAVFYLGYYLFGSGPSSRDEYIAEVQQAKIEVDAFNKKNALNVDESNVKFADAAGIEEGKTIFKTNCVACHGNSAEGNVGPNLTDDYWIHGGGANNLFKTVKYGWPAKGMKSWQNDLSPVQIRYVISYVHSLHGTNPPNAKAPQGDLYVEPTAAKTDSTVVAVVDTLKK